MIIPEDLQDLQIAPPGWKWNRGQRALVEKIVNSPKKVILLEAECGSGKSLIAVASAAAANARAIVLIDTIQLQEQYRRDFASARMMAGRKHSICNITGESADEAPCTAKVKCDMRGQWDFATGLPMDTPECAYYARKAAAALSQISIQNYAYWFAETKSVDSTFNKRPWIICDEAHKLDAICMQVGTIEITQSAVDAVLGDNVLALPRSQDHETCAEWAFTLRMQVGPILEDLELEIESGNASRETTSLYRRANNLYRAATEIGNLNTETDWPAIVIQRTYKPDRLLYKPIYGKYGFRRLLEAAQEKIILMSAFLAPDLLIKTLDLNPDDVEIIRAPQVFDRRKSPVYYCPTTKMSFKTPDITWRAIANTIDTFADYYKSPGFIHVPSVRLRDLLLQHMQCKDRLIAYDGGDNILNTYGSKQKALDDFITRSNNGEHPILLGQSISTGVDIDMIPRWQVIVKLPYMPLDDPAVERRKEVDKSYYPYYSICEIVQATGRIKRSQPHDGVTIILDAQFRWFYRSQFRNFPKWFSDSLRMDGWQWLPNEVRQNARRAAMRFGLDLTEVNLV